MRIVFGLLSVCLMANSILGQTISVAGDLIDDDGIALSARDAVDIQETGSINSFGDVLKPVTSEDPDDFS